MLYLVNVLLKLPVELRRFIKFSLVGVVNTVIDFLIFFIAINVAGLHYLFANIISWFVAVGVSFFLNKFWTFKSVGVNSTASQYARFTAVSLVALGLSLLLLYVFVEIMSLHELVGKILTIGIVVFWNFFMNRLWTFKHAR